MLSAILLCVDELLSVSLLSRVILLNTKDASFHHKGIHISANEV